MGSVTGSTQTREDSWVKESPLQALKAHGDVDRRVLILAATALRRKGKVASPTLDRLYAGKAPVIILYVAEWPQDQSGHEGAKKKKKSRKEKSAPVQHPATWYEKKRNPVKEIEIKVEG